MLKNLLITYSNLKNQASQVSTNSEKGELGESIADLVMKRVGYEKLPAKVGSNNGFDGIYVKRDNNGNVQDIIINESKFGTSRLRKTKVGFLQMSKPWIKMNLKKMLKSTDDDVLATAEVLRDNYHLIRTKMNRLKADGTNKWSSDPGGFGK